MAEPGFDALGEPSHQREAPRAKPDQPVHKALDVIRREAMSSLPKGSSRKGMHNERRQRCEIPASPSSSNERSHEDRNQTLGHAFQGGVQGVRPSSAHRVRRATSQPSHAPLPSSETGKPQPPTRWRLPSTMASPTLPVPMMMMPPSPPRCAPTQAACEVGGEDRRPEGMLIDFQRGEDGRSLAPAKAMQEQRCDRQEQGPHCEGVLRHRTLPQNSPPCQSERSPDRPGLPENFAGKIAELGPAPRAAAVYSQKKWLCIPPRSSGTYAYLRMRGRRSSP